MTAIMTTLMPFYQEIMTAYCTDNITNNIQYGVTSRRPSMSGGAIAKCLDLDLDGFAQFYDDVIINVLDRFIPFRTVKCRRRPSDPWFEEECRAAKCPTRRLELDGRHVQCRSRCCCHRRVENSTPSLPRPA